MGTWGEGLLDNDIALDELPTLIRVDLSQSAAHLAGGVALLALFGQIYDLEQAASAASGAAALPESAAAELRAVFDDMDTTLGPQARSAAVRDVVGEYCSGPRLSALFDVPGVDSILDEVASRCVAALDQALEDESVDLYELAGELTPLAVLLELDAPVDGARKAKWRAGFDAIDLATTAEREFWDVYGAKVRRGIAMLRET